MLEGARLLLPALLQSSGAAIPSSSFWFTLQQQMQLALVSNVSARGARKR
jgi:hypothetical protein